MLNEVTDIDKVCQTLVMRSNITEENAIRLELMKCIIETKLFADAKNPVWEIKRTTDTLMKAFKFKCNE